jgi:phosphoenolpyruvate carboxylase
MNRYVIEQNFHEFVENKYQFLNSVFLGLHINQNYSGKELQAFHGHVLTCLEEKKSPEEIISSFFPDSLNDQEIIDLLFLIVKYIERDVVLFDAIEDAAFEKINNLNGANSLAYMISSAIAAGKSEDITTVVAENRIRLVLTAHPTQFYPGTILGIINDLNQAIRENDLSRINTLLAQLSYTPFFSKKKPTPFDEALSLIWYLENVFFDAVLNIQEIIKNTLPGHRGGLVNPDLIELGFWPGGDRDGNPFVTADITLQVADRLRSSILQKYHDEIKNLKRQLTFKGVFDKLRDMEALLNESISSNDVPVLSRKRFLEGLYAIKSTLEEKYNSIYVKDIERLINTIEIFGYHFATLDIRQDNNTHREVITAIFKEQGTLEAYTACAPEDRSEFLYKQSAEGKLPEIQSEIAGETLQSIQAIEKIQQRNGERGCHRYIISNCQCERDIYELMALFRFAGWNNEISVDIVPLFETIPDLENAASVMANLYSDEHYRKHLESRGNRQTIMLGFSDGTKDGGYFTANWSIYKAKETLTAISRQYNITVIFFDGRGGPAARGGGKTHNYYASHGRSIENREIQLTVQGQTVSSNFGTVMSAQYNMEQLISAGIKNRLYSKYNADFTPEDRVLMEKLSNRSYEAYKQLKEHDKFTDYLVNRSAMPYYGKANIGSRPDRRRTPEKFTLKDLRAIPFVGSWNLNKQNIPGFYGLGTAIIELIKEEGSESLHEIYNRSRFFKTLIQNSMMVLKKTNFDITRHHSQDKQYQDLWLLLYDEFSRSSETLLSMSGENYLMESNIKDRLSVELREETIMPLCVIQQYALCRIQQLKESGDNASLVEKYEHMVIRSSYGIINAGRNLA